MAFLGPLILFTSNILLPPEINPDWAAYERIYNSGGAWLLESARDGAFIHIIAMFKLLSPDASYEAFRATLLVGFALFVWILLKGTAVFYPRDRSALIFMAIFVLGLLRFTVQIREGLALVFYLISLGHLHKSEGVRAGFAPQKSRRKTYSAVMSWLFALLAAGTHFAGVILLSTKLAGYIIAQFNRSSRSLLFKTGWVFLGLFVIALIFRDLIIADINSLALEYSGDRELTNGQFTIASLIYWIVNGLIFYYLYKIQGAVPVASPRLPPQIQVQATIVAGPLTALALSGIFILKFGGAAPLAIVLLVRVFDMLIAMTLVYVAMYSRAGVGLFVVSLLLIFKGLNGLL